MTNSSWTRRAATAAVGLALVAATAACGGNSADGSDAAAGDGDGAFPVTIEHKFGSTTIESEPENVVTAGLTDHDAVLALGTVPVGTTEWLGLHESAIGPWAIDYVGDEPMPELLDDTNGPQREAITLLAPDVIFALYAGLTQEQYDNLSEVAPVVAAPEGYLDYGIPWQEQTEIIGTALGKPDEARQLIADTEALFTDYAEQHPELANATGIVATPWEGWFVYGDQDPRSRMLTTLGLDLPTELSEALSDGFGGNISKERADLFDQDVVIWLVDEIEAGSQALHSDPAYANLAVSDEGREIFIEHATDYGGAFSFVTPLSLAYVLERLVPQLAAAVDGDPATEVPEVS